MIGTTIKYLRGQGQDVSNLLLHVAEKKYIRSVARMINKVIRKTLVDLR